MEYCRCSDFLHVFDTYTMVVLLDLMEAGRLNEESLIVNWISPLVNLLLGHKPSRMISF